MSERSRLQACAALAIACGLASLHAQPAESPAEKVQRLVEGSGFSNKHPKPNVWVIPAKGPAKGDFDLFVAVSDNIVVIGAVIAKKAEMPAAPEFYQTLLRANHNMDYVKVGLDGDGDAFARAEINNRFLDAAELKMLINQTTAATDEVYNRIKQFLK